MSSSPIIWGGSNSLGLLLPANASGYLKTDSSGNISISASGSAASYNVTSQTTTYSANANDFVIASGASFTITLPTAVGVSGQTVGVYHNGTSLSQVYTINTTSSQTITYNNTVYTSGQIALYTNAEIFYFTSNGTNWDVTNHVANTGWISLGNAVTYRAFTVSAANATIGATYTNNGATFTVCQTISGGTTLTTQCFSGAPTSSGTLTKASGTGDATITFSAVAGANSTITATTTNPVYYGAPTINQLSFMRRGNLCTLFLQFYQASSGAVAGSGDFIYAMPSNMTIDTTYYPTYTGGTAQTFLGETPATMINVQPSVNGNLANSSGPAYLQLNGVAPYSSTSFRLYGSDSSTTTNGFAWGSAIGTALALQSINFQVTLPISGWLP